MTQGGRGGQDIVGVDILCGQKYEEMAKVLGAAFTKVIFGQECSPEEN